MEVRNQERPTFSKQFAYYLSMSVFSALIGGFLFTRVWSLVDEDTGVLLFFFGLPMIIGASFTVMVALSKRLFQQDRSKDMLRRAGLLAAVLAGIMGVCVPHIIESFRAMLPSSLLDVTSNWMIGGIWVATLLISSVLFPLAMRRER